MSIKQLKFIILYLACVFACTQVCTMHSIVLREYSSCYTDDIPWILGWFHCSLVMKPLGNYVDHPMLRYHVIGRNMQILDYFLYVHMHTRMSGYGKDHTNAPFNLTGRYNGFNSQAQSYSQLATTIRQNPKISLTILLIKNNELEDLWDLLAFDPLDCIHFKFPNFSPLETSFLKKWKVRF